MIQLKHVFKTYNENTPNAVEALKDINITFEEKGMSFIIGKSGSGKSTLLNMIGSLDSATSGEINVDGNLITNNNESLLDDYRNSYLGFVFQDFYLINSLTVFDNVALALTISDNLNDEKIKETLKKVGLENEMYRNPETLSGGQKQRVAIARSIVKSPKILLCDEPTGNLDSKTSKQIMTLLKELSKDILVIVVSHNLNDAYLYGDRIIEIKDGQIINDLENTSTNNSYEIKENKLFIDDIELIDKSSLDEINSKIKNGEITSISSKHELFKARKNNDEMILSKPFKKTKISFKEKMKISFKLTKKHYFGLFFVSILVALVTTLLGLSQAFVSFSSDKILNDVLSNSNQNSLAFKKGTFLDKNKQDVDLTTLISLNETDDNLVKESGYDGNIYKLYNYSLPLSLKSWQLSTESTIIDSYNIQDLYLQEIYGVLPTDMNLLNKLFGEKFNVTGNLNDKNYGLIITDYIADSILYYRSDLYSTYEEILHDYRNNSNSVYGYINAIIDTNYKEKHKKVFETYREDFTTNELEEFIMSDEYLSFYEDVKNTLGIAYSLNPNFINDSRVKAARNIVRFDNSILTLSDKTTKIPLDTAWAYADNVVSDLGLKDMTMCVSLSNLNRILNKNYSIEEASFLNGSEITISRYHRYKENDESLKDIKASLKVVETSSFSTVVSDKLFEELRNYDVMPYMYYFDKLDNAYNLYNILKEHAFVPYSSVLDAANEINKVVYVFQDFFALTLTLLVLILVIILSNYAYAKIRQSSYNIGILKALGMSNKDLIQIFILQIVALGLLTTIFFIPSLFAFNALTNNILFNSFMTYLKNPALKYISILNLNPLIFVIDILVIFGVTLLTALIPFLMMKKIKPLNIIKRKE